METDQMTLTDDEDVDLIDRARGGDKDAFGELFLRHREAARRAAVACGPNSAVREDLVSEAFARIWALFQRGEGPTTSFRAYLITTIRHIATRRPPSALTWTGQLDEEAWASSTPEPPFLDPSDTLPESDVMRAAFDSLPERWRVVLWHLEVEQLSTHDVAELLGLESHAVASLAYRAREGLAKAYLQQHLEPGTGACGKVRGKLGAYARAGLPPRAAKQVETHVGGCDRCSEILDSAQDVNRWLRSRRPPARAASRGR